MLAGPMITARRLLEGRSGLERLGRLLPRPVRARARRILRPTPRPPFLLGKPGWGNLRRSYPFGEFYGSDRGTPIDRAYIADFLRSCSDDIRGEVLEIGAEGYTGRFGGSHVTVAHVLDVDPGNRAATIIADLSEPDALPAGRFQCFLLLQTLQYVSDVEAGLKNAWRALVPGGTLLISVPTITRIDPRARGADSWRFTPAGLERAVRRACPDADVQIRGYGSLVTATAFLMGLASEELTDSERAFFDPDFAVLACARARKAPS